MRRLYLDHNATTPLDPRLLPIIAQAMEQDRGNPASLHSHGQSAKRQLETSRETLACFFGVKPQEVIFTSGGTEGAALLLYGLILPHWRGHVISSGAEHAAVYYTLKTFEKWGVEVSFLQAGTWGAVTAEQVEAALRPDTRLITVMAVNNETGVKTDLPSIAAVAQRARVPLIVDGVAWLGKERVAFPSGVSAAFFSGHKIHAPKGIGCVVCRQSLRCTPLFYGGGQEYHRRAGTENVAGAVALATAISLLEREQEVLWKQMEKLRNHFEYTLLTSLSHVLINGEGPRVCNTSNLSFMGVDGESLLYHLDLAGLSASHGSACASGALEPSRILLDMGLPLARVRSAVRFSLGHTTTKEEIDEALPLIISIVNRLRR